MGIQAAYTQVDEPTLDRLVTLPPDQLADALEALETAGAPTVYLDKLWDGLHFLLTGRSASTPIDGDPLSEAVVGVHVFEGEDYVGCTEHDELPGIIAALEAVDLPALLATTRFETFAAAEVYPAIWTEDPERLGAELAEAFGLLVDVHRAARAARGHLVVSIL